MIFTEYLNGFLRDTLTILGGVGLPLTALGVWLAYRQLCKTASAAEAASTAAVSALNENRRQYNHHAIAQSHRLLTEASIYVTYRAWKQAGMRVNDLTQLLLHVTDHDWSQFVRRLQSMEKHFKKLDSNQCDLTPGMKGKWETLEQELTVRIVENLAPFPEDQTELHNGYKSEIQDRS